MTFESTATTTLNVKYNILTQLCLLYKNTIHNILIPPVKKHKERQYFDQFLKVMHHIV